MTKTLRQVVLFVLALHCSNACRGESVWTEVKSVELEEGQRRHRMLKSVEDKLVVDIDFHALKAAASGRDRTNSGIPFSFPEGERRCQVKASPVLHPDLAAKVPELKVLHGKCSDGSQLSLNFIDNDASSVTASFEDKDGDAYLVDSFNGKGNRYFVYKRSVVKKHGENTHADFHCDTDSHVQEEDESEGPTSEPHLRRLQTNNIEVTTLRIAISTSFGYTKFHGGTISSVLNSLSTMLNRLNGVFLRELGIYFQLFADNDKIICLDSKCPLDDTSTWNSMNQNPSFISERTNAYFDLGHVLVLAGGGVATYPALCDNNKAAGCSGHPYPENDPFWIDLVAHELGHQFKGAHSFRYCDGTTNNFMLAGAVEPGGGTTIMSYSGTCGNNNLQSYSDPYFNSNNLVDMRALLNSRVNNVAGCGTRQAISNTPKPQVVLPISSCTVPVGNFVTLTGDATGPSGADWAFAWDRIDRGSEVYSDQKVARFRPWKPTASKSRNLPNLYYILFGMVDNQLFEILPKTSQTMKFRFIARTQYDTGATATSLQLGSVGAFDYKDVSISFSTSYAPLRITNTASQLASPGSFLVTWVVGGTSALSSNVNIQVAINTMTQVSKFDYEKDLVELNWMNLGTFPNNGVATVSIPSNLPVNSQAVLRIRSTGANCGFFDLKKFIVVQGSGGGTEPMPDPTANPTRSPVPQALDTASPTRSPTVMPTPLPTKARRGKPLNPCRIVNEDYTGSRQKRRACSRVSSTVTAERKPCRWRRRTQCTLQPSFEHLFDSTTTRSPTQYPTRSPTETRPPNPCQMVNEDTTLLSGRVQKRQCRAVTSDVTPRKPCRWTRRTKCTIVKKYAKLFDN